MECSAPTAENLMPKKLTMPRETNSVVVAAWEGWDSSVKNAHLIIYT